MTNIRFIIELRDLTLYGKSFRREEAIVLPNRN